MVKPGPEGSEEFNISRCRRSKIGGGISLLSRASSTSPCCDGNVRFMASKYRSNSHVIGLFLCFFVVLSSATRESRESHQRYKWGESRGGGEGR